jgi:hypothetical protein
MSCRPPQDDASLKRVVDRGKATHPQPNAQRTYYHNPDGTLDDLETQQQLRFRWTAALHPQPMYYHQRRSGSLGYSWCQRTERRASSDLGCALIS